MKDDYFFNLLVSTSKYVLVLLLNVIPLTLLHAQSGPGGIGNSDGSGDQPENIVWLDASDLSSFGDGDTWFDKSGNGNNAINIGGSGGAILGSINGTNAINLVASNTGLLSISDDHLGANKLDGMADLTIISVVNSGNSNPRAILSKRLDAGNRSYAFFTMGSNYNLRAYGGAYDITSNVNIGANSNAIGTYVYQNGGDFSIYSNGNLGATRAVSTPIPDRSDDLLIGTFNTGDGRYFNGQIGEVIMYRTALNSAQRKIVESYLGTKYNIALPFNAFTTGDVNFNKDISGVGVEVDGTQGLSSSQGLYLSLRDSLAGDYVMAAHDNTINDIANINVGGDVTAAGAQAAWNRAWYVEQTGTPTVRLSFDLNEGIGGQYPQEFSNYVLLHKATPGGSYAVVTTSLKGVENGNRIYFEVTDANFTNGYYTLGTLDQTLSPVEGGSRRIWYTLRSTANWDEPGAWTLEPCGCLPNNPNGYTPITSPTGPSDKVVILSGNKMTVPLGVNSLVNAEIVVDGELDLLTTSGHTFSTIKGRGQVTMSADNFPVGDAYDFVTPGEGMGKVVYKGAGYKISNDHEFYNVDVVLSSALGQIDVVSNLKVNGSLRVEQGILGINDNSATTPLNIDVLNEMYVGADGQVVTGTANVRHQLNLYGDLTNLGTVKFTQRTVPIYGSEATDGIVDVNLLSSTTDQVVTCDGPSNFYRIEIDKGVDKTYVASINASAVANFNLFGRANYSHASVAQLTTNDNALGLIRGTVRIGQNVIINQISSWGNYNISVGARLWVDGGEVTKSSGWAIVPYGEVNVSAGTLNVNVNSGITLRDNGIIKVDGGELNVYQIRTSVLGSEHQGGYVQTGGVTNVTAISSNTDYYAFNLTYEGNTFQMTGGILNINQANSNGGIFINSLPANYNVTGGTVNCNIANNTDFVITSRAPFYNLNLSKTGGSATMFVLEDGIDIGSTNVDLVAQPLVVLNDLRIRGEETGIGYPDIQLRARASNVRYIDVKIGGSLFIEEGASYHARRNDTYQNTTWFNQTAATSAIDSLYFGSKTNSQLELGHFVLDRISGNELRTVAPDARNNQQIMIDVNGDASVESGTLCQGRMTFRTWGKITNKDRMGTWYADGPYPTANGTPSAAQIRFREDPPVEILTSTGAVFGNLRFNVNPATTHVTLTSDMKIDRMEFMRGAIYLKGFRLTIDNMWNLDTGSNEIFVDRNTSDELIVSDNGITGNKIIYTDGKASDGGLELYVSQNTPIANGGRRDRNESPITFPIGYTTDGGTSIYNRPAQLKVKDFSDDGYVNIRPVSGDLKTTNATGSTEVLQQYWRVSHSDFTTVPTVALQFYYRDQEGLAGVDKVASAAQEANYVPGYVLDEAPYTRRYESDNIDNASAPVSDISDVVNTGTAGVTRRIVFNGASTGGDFAQGSFAGFPLINANFTCGEVGRFSGAPTLYYTNANYQNWNNGSIWHKGSKNSGDTGEVPTEGSIVFIYKDGPNQGRVSVRSGMITEAPAEVNFVHNYTVYPIPDVENMPRLQFYESGTFDIGRVSGTGMVSLNNGGNPTVIADWGNFANNMESILMYFGGNTTLTNVIQPVPSLMIEGSTVSIDQEIVINANLILTGNTRLRPLQNMLIKRNLYVGAWSGGTFDFPGTGSPLQIEVEGNVDYTYVNTGTQRRIRVENPGVNNLIHRLIVHGDINMGSNNAFVMDLYNGNDRPRVELELKGEGTNTYTRTSTAVPQLYRLIMNKGTDATSSFIFDRHFTIGGLTNGASKAIELQNGLLVLDDTNFNVNLSTGSDYFTIPGTSALELRQGVANINGGSGLSLDGLLRISGGTLDMSGGDHPIVYSVSGNAVIEVSGATSQLLVGSQIRRPETDALGVLKYLQTEGSVQIGVSSGGVTSRGMFEVLNTGSSFTHTGGAFTIVRQNGATPTIAALLLEPSSYTLTGSTVTLFNGLTPVGQSAFGINSTIPLNNLVVNGTNNPTAQIEVRDCYLDGDLTIASGGSFDAKGFAIDIKGDWTNNGTFIPTANEVMFTGSVPQVINGTTSFYQLTKKLGGDILSLGTATDITVENLMTLSDGVIHDGGNDINIKKDIVNNGVFTSAGGNGVVLNGNTPGNPQLLSGDGSFDRMTLNNPGGFELLDGNTMTINNNFQMESGVFNIGKNLIVFGEDATVQSVSGFSATNMIETNISFVDAGLKKFLPLGPVNFVYPMGSGGLYTPLNLNMTGNSATNAYIRVKGAREVHPSVIDEVATPWNERENVLKYYWILDANGLTDFTGSLTMEYPNSLVGLTPPRLYSEYITARLLSRSNGLWDKGSATVDTSNDLLIYNITTATNDDGISGDYTAGIDEAIPDQVPTYTSQKDGDWTDVSVWLPTPPTGGPRGAQVVVEHDVNIPVDYISSYRTTIDGTTNGRILIQPATGGHRLGVVDGTGTIYLENGSLPAGEYTTFLNTGGGTLEFGGTAQDYPVLGGITTVNNIKFSGTGTRNLPNDNLSILGDLTIEQGAGVLIVDNAYDKTINVKKDLIYNSGTFTAGSGLNAAVVMNGMEQQTIRGLASFTGANALYNLSVDNAAGVVLSTDVEVARVLTLNNGNVNSELGSLTLSYSEINALQGGGSNSYVEGPLVKRINLNESFTFPIGRIGRYGEIHISNTSIANGLWEASYFNTNPTGGGYDVSSRAVDLAFVNHNEYWTVKAPSAATANLTLHWDAYSGVVPDNDFTLAMWRNTIPEWDKIDITNKTGTAASGQVSTLSALSFNEFSEGNTITFGSFNIPEYDWVGNAAGDNSNWFNPSNWGSGSVPGAATNITIPDQGAAPVIDNSTLAQVNDLTINHSGGLILQAGAHMTINGNLVTNERLFVQTSNSNPVSIITHGTVTGNVSYQWTYDALRWWFIGHSISNPQMDSYRDITVVDPTNRYAMYDYQNPGTLVPISSDPVYNFPTNDQLRGYQLKVLKGGTSVDHLGTLNTDVLYEKDVQVGWQIVANPYASYYQLPYDPSPAGDFAETTGSVYVTISTTNQDKVYQTFNTNTGIASPGEFAGIIAPSQAFYVKTVDTPSAGAKIRMRASNRVHDVNKASLKSKEVTVNKLIRIELSNKHHVTDEAVIALHSDGDLGMSRMDSEQRYYNDTGLSYVYSIVDEHKVVINVLPEALNNYQQLLGMQVQDGEQEIQIKGIKALQGAYDLILEDKLMGISTAMTAESVYKFTSEAGTFDDRFVLHFNEIKVPTGVDDVDKGNDQMINVYIENESTLRVTCDWDDQDKTVFVYTIAGHQVFNGSFDGNQFESTLPLKTGVYIVKVVGENNVYEQKVFVK